MDSITQNRDHRNATGRGRDGEVNQELLKEVRATRLEIAQLRRLFDDFAGAFLNARFKFGKPADRWARR